jgi:hypothetical protein
MDAKPNCETCGLRARYDRNPRSLLGRLWRWHAGWCPGFKKYMTSLPQEERTDLARRYGLKKYMQ